MKIIAIIVLFLCAPIMLVLAVLLYFQDGEVIFRQVRIGKDKGEFVIYKFKTMENNTITTIGRIIRKLGLDELPQLYNIVKGDMAFVGPRPLTKFDIDRLAWNGSEYSDRWSVKPGITGIAQLSTVCDATISMQNDLNYINNRSWYLDLSIILKSLMVPVFGKRTK